MKPWIADRLDAEWPEDERNREGGRGVPEVDRDAKAGRPDAVDVERVEEVLRICLADAGGVRGRPHLRGGGAADLLPAVVALDALAQRVAHLDAGRLEDPDLDDVGVVERATDVDARAETLRLQHVTGDRRRRDPQVRDVDAGRGESRDHGALDHPAGVGGVAARHHAGARLERGAERRAEAHGDLGREVDVDAADDAVAAEQAARGSTLPDDVLVDLRAGLDHLERIDPDAGKDACLGADHRVVPDGDVLVDPCVVAQVAAVADDRALHDRSTPHMHAGTEDRVRHPRARLQRHAAREHGVRPDGRRLGDPAVRPDERGPFDRREVAHGGVLGDPHVARQADPGDLEPDLPLQGVEVRDAELLERPDVVPVAVEDVPVHRHAALEQVREDVLREVRGRVCGDVSQHLRLDHVDPGVDGVGEHLAP